MGMIRDDLLKASRLTVSPFRPHTTLGAEHLADEGAAPSHRGSQGPGRIGRGSASGEGPGPYEKIGSGAIMAPSL